MLWQVESEVYLTESLPRGTHNAALPELIVSTGQFLPNKIPRDSAWNNFFRANRSF